MINLIYFFWITGFKGKKMTPLFFVKFNGEKKPLKKHCSFMRPHTEVYIHKKICKHTQKQT